MKKKKERKINKWIATFQALWKHPRYHAMIKLGLYFIFVGGVLIFIQVTNMTSNGQKEVTYRTPLEQFAEQTSYQYQMKLEEENSSILVQSVHGTNENGLHKFTVDGVSNSYIIQDGLYYLAGESSSTITNNPVLFDITHLTPNMINKMLESGEEIATTTYKTGIVETTYEVPLKSFMSLYQGIETELIESIIVKVQIENNKVVQIYLDWTSYRKIQVPTMISSHITLIFS